MANFEISVNAVKQYCEDIDYCMNEADTFKKFIQNRQFTNSCSFALEQIGELVKAHYRAFKNLSEDIPWENIKGIRIIIAHKYLDANMEIIWKTCKEDIPKLESVIDDAIQFGIISSEDTKPRRIFSSK